MICPKTWKKYGEVYSDDRKKCIFVCSICLENVERNCFAFFTSNASEFSNHIQQHISADCEIPKEPPTKNSHTETQQQYCASPATDCKMNIADSTDSRTIDQVQDQIKLLDRFHERLVGNFDKNNLNNKNITKEQQQMDVKIENEYKMETEVTLKNESAFENTSVIIQDHDKQKNKSSKNYSYISDHEIYTIPDDSEDDDDFDDKDDEQGVVKELSARDYLFHNDMIELSDEDDLDEVDTRPNSFQSVETDKENNKDNQDNQAEIVTNNSLNSGYNCLSYQKPFLNRNNLINHLANHEIEASDPQSTQSFPIDSLNCIPTPVSSPNDILYSQNVHSNFPLYPCSYCPQRFNEVLQLDRHQRLHLYNFDATGNYKSRPIQCNICGRRTITEKSMIIHQRRFHSAESNSETTPCEICHKNILKRNLQQHMWIHTKYRYKCDYCNKTYKQKQSLRIHIHKDHPNSEINNNPSVINLAAYETPYTNQLRQNDNPEVEPQSLLDSPQVSQPQLTPEEQELMYTHFLQCQIENIQNKEQSST